MPILRNLPFPGVIAGSGTIIPPPPIVIAFAGSSSPAYYLTQGTIPTADNRVTVTDDGTTYATLTTGRHGGELGRQIADATGRNVRFIKGGIAGSTLAQWAAASSTQRSALVTKINAAIAAGSPPDEICIQVGNNDLDAGGNSYAERLGLWRQLISSLRSEIGRPNQLITIGGCQSKPAAKPVRVGWQREAEMTVANNDANVRFAFSTYDLPTSDGQHQTDASQVISGARHAAQSIAYLKGTQQSRAPFPSGITRVSDTVVRMLVSYPAGESDYTPAGGLTGGYLVPNGGTAGSEIAGTGVRVSASAIDWTFPSTPGATNFIFQPNEPTTDIIIYGNDPLGLPMEPDAGQFAVPASAATSPTLNALTVNNNTATAGTAYTGTISGATAGSSLALTGAGAAGLSISGTTISGTPTTAGAVNIVETLAGATNSPRTSSGVIAVAAAGATYTATGKSAKQHYASGASQPPGETPTGFNSFIISEATTVKALNTPAGASSGWSTSTTAKAGDLSSNASGQSTGNNTGVYPDGALIGNWYTVGNQTETFTGLDSAKYYDIYVCGSRSGTTGRSTLATVAGLTTPASQTLVVDSNTANRLTFAKLKPNASGVITVTWGLGNQTYGYLCVIELVEYTGP